MGGGCKLRGGIIIAKNAGMRSRATAPEVEEEEEEEDAVDPMNDLAKYSRYFSPLLCFIHFSRRCFNHLGCWWLLVVAVRHQNSTLAENLQILEWCCC